MTTNAAKQEVLEPEIPVSIVEYTATAKALAELNDKYAGVVYDVGSKEGRAAAIAGRAELRGYRIALEKTRVKIKAPALEHARKIDSEAKMLTERLQNLETPIDDQIKADERRKAAELQAKIDAENARIAAEEAERKRQEEAVLRAQREENARRAAELAKREAEQRAREDAERRRIDDEQRAAREKIMQEQREAQRLIDEANERARQERIAEEQRLREQREKIDAERRAVEERERAAREAKEAEERAARAKADEEAHKQREAAEEVERQKREAAWQRADAMNMLKTFVDKYGSLPEFQTIANRIKSFLEPKKRGKQ